MATVPTHKTLYHNIKVRDLEGEIIFTASERKAGWYLDRNLAKEIGPGEIQLTFQAKGKGDAGDPFYLQDRKDECVVCGSNRRLTKHHIVPISYRKCFPPEIKDNSHHDVLPICVRHHDEYNIHEQEFRKQLSKEYQVPLDGLYEDGYNHNDFTKLQKDAYALIAHGHRIPPEKTAFLWERIRRITGDPHPDLAVIRAMKYPVIIKTQGELIVEQLKSLEEIQAFIQRWRTHFVEIMRPMFLPKHWSITRTER